MYRYLLFGFDDCYPCGGMEDLVLKFNTFEDVEKNLKYKDNDCWQLVDVSRNFSWQEFKSKNDYTNESREELVKWIRDSL